MSDGQSADRPIDWRGADLRGGNFTGVNLEKADLRAAELRGVNFTGCNLRYGDLHGANVQGANFQNASLYAAKMQGVEACQADFRGADLRLANFGGAYLEGAMMPPPVNQRTPTPSEIASHPPGPAPQHQNGQERSRGR